MAGRVSTSTSTIVSTFEVGTVTRRRFYCWH